ncbi:unnamed protein product [Phytophthora fragariaefolia]|uniref:ATP-dependent DNA helicase n=1 Tax=Phytophthora fragariaefolia TaxID=1490495 RepID=A0A9W6XHP8_9STRA|nr:unnamed protein product [Phytophthora fragariaefolia]
MGGRTAHSTFKIPLKLDKKSVCSIHKQSKLKKLFQEASLIIWDAAPMTHRHAFEAVDRSLRDVLNNDEDPFGGKTVVLSGDFRQILPVVVRGTPAETIDACLKSSHLWSHFRQVHITENMRVRAAHSAETAAELAAFSDFLLQVGEGRLEVNRQLDRDYMKLPRSMLIDDPPEAEVDEDEVIAPGAIRSGLKRLIDVMYPDVNNQAIATDAFFANPKPQAQREAKMVSGRRRFDALPDDGYTESKIISRSWSPGLRTNPSGRSNPDSTSGWMTRHQVIAYLICTHKVLPDSKYSQAKMLTTDQDHQPGFAAHRLPPWRPPDGRHDYATSDHSETKIKEAAFRDIVGRWPNRLDNQRVQFAKKGASVFGFLGIRSTVKQ